MDISVTHDNFSAKDFNPLPRKEGDGLSCKGLLWIRYFNPLPRKEGDSIVSVTVGVPPISIHSLVKRETAHRAERFEVIIIFQSTPS